MKKKAKFAFLSIFLILFMVLIFSQSKEYHSTASTSEAITIGIPSNPYIQDLSTNYYKEWLEKETGLKLQFILLPQEYTSEYLDQMFRSENIPMDALFSFPCENDVVSANSKLQEYGKKGYILPLNDYINHSSLTKKLFSDFKLYNLKKAMTSPDGNIYYMPGLDSSITEECPQIMWINQSWLTTLGMPIPKTLEEFHNVLQAFQKNDPNGNSKQDEIPLAGSTNILGEQSYNFLINSFVYNDPDNCRMVVQNGVVSFAPSTLEWRESVEYLHDLYQQNLLDSFQFTINHQQLVQLANDPRNLLGAFTSSSITDVLLSSSPEIMSNYVRVPPLIGPSGKCYATVKTPLPKPNGVITSSCKNPKAAFQVLELMLSKEAFLIGRYGQEGVDWTYAKSGDIDIFGNDAVLRVKNQLRHKTQNKTLSEMGPFFSYPEYTSGVAWNGIEWDQEYINARAYRLYQKYQPKEYIKTIFMEGDAATNLMQIQKNIEFYTDANLKNFIQGELNPYDDSQWNAYLKKYNDLGIKQLILAMQQSYSSLHNNKER